ncbi:hypothetical protein CYMTET_26035, partial [Cymbomonas tetramitiformis]
QEAALPTHAFGKEFTAVGGGLEGDRELTQYVVKVEVKKEYTQDSLTESFSSVTLGSATHTKEKMAYTVLDKVSGSLMPGTMTLILGDLTPRAIIGARLAGALPFSLPSWAGSRAERTASRVQGVLPAQDVRQSAASRGVEQGLPDVESPPLLSKICAGQLPLPKDAFFKGHAAYNGMDAGKMNIPRLVGYVGQMDHHNPGLTVRETLKFAQSVYLNADGAPTLHDTSDGVTMRGSKSKVAAMINHNMEILMKSLSLSSVANKVVGFGPEHEASSSGGGLSIAQRRQLTVGEILTGFHRALMLDDLTTGMDFASSTELIRNIAQSTKTFSFSVMASVLQPNSEIMSMFDDLLLLNAGSMYFYGPCAQVQNYFYTLGYRCPSTKDLAGFILDIPGRTGKQYKDPNTGPHMSFDVLCARYYASPIAAESMEHSKKAQRFQANMDFSQMAPFLMEGRAACKIVFRRELRKLRGESRRWRMHADLCIIASVLSGTLFFRMDTNDYQNRIGSFFFTSVFLSLVQQTHLISCVNDKVIFFKQRDMHLFPAYAYTFARAFLQVPLTIIADCGVYVTITYFLMNHATHNLLRHYIRQLWLVFFGSSCFSQAFRAIAAVSRTHTIGQVLGSVFIMGNVIMSGYVCSPEKLSDYFIWISWGCP